jgi:hypothetical protein
MKNKEEKGKQITRRGLLPLLIGGFLLPYLGQGNTKAENIKEAREDDDVYETFLKADGTIVRVKRKAARGARVIKKNLSNRSLLGWLKKK